MTCTNPINKKLFIRSAAPSEHIIMQERAVILPEAFATYTRDIIIQFYDFLAQYPKRTLLVKDKMYALDFLKDEFDRVFHKIAHIVKTPKK